MTDMPSTTTRELETLCEKEFELVRTEAYDDLDREISSVRNYFASQGSLLSSGMAQNIVDAVLARYDKVLAGFESVYLGKWEGTNRGVSDSDYEWLLTKARAVLEPEAQEVQFKCNSFLRGLSLSFAPFWQNAGIQARARNARIFQKIEILKLKMAEGKMAKPAPPIHREASETFSSIWSLLHPSVVKTARTRFESGHYADAAEAVFKEINDIVRKMVKDQTGEEYDGSDLMNRAFSLKNPVIKLDDLGTETGRNIQVGYMQMLSGSMTGIRNPKAHSNIKIEPGRSIHFLFVASLLLSKIDERIP
jgi:uncharacterized protein (TIGR02391 family)